MADIVLDYDREARCGVGEGIFCEGKSSQQIVRIVDMAIRAEKRMLLTRLSPQQWQELPEETRNALRYNSLGFTALLGEPRPLADNTRVAVVSAGASDTRICHEIESTLNFHGYGCTRIEDVGVSALWRLNDRLPEIANAQIIIAVAGMEAALPTVLCGLVSAPMIAVPTSVGYGISEGGKLALHALLGSCAAGMSVVNIDNGFGAACAAIRMLRQIDQCTAPVQNDNEQII